MLEKLGAMAVLAALAAGFAAEAPPGEKVPWSVSGSDEIYYPMILRDFPEFQLDFAKREVEDVLRRAISLHYQGVRSTEVHRTVIRDYQRRGSGATVLFQTAIGFVSQAGQQEALVNTEYGCEASAEENARCGFCGAPVGSLSSARCEYCGTRLARSWKVIRFHEMNVR